MDKKFIQINEMSAPMHKQKRNSRFTNSAWIVMLLMTVLMWQCEKDTFEGETIGVCPEVTTSNPLDGAVNVATNKIITATFNEAMVPATINNETFTVLLGTVPVSGIVSYTDSVAIFTPTKPLEANKTYTGNITKKVKDPAGNYPLENYTWSFSTGNVPTINSTDPLNGTSNVPLNKIIEATFSTAMDPLTINSETFLFYQGTNQINETTTENKGMPLAFAKQVTNSIAGKVSYSGNTATFTPTNPLAENTVYTGTITIGATDVLGNAVAAGYQWSFSTALTTYTIDLSSNPVDAGSTIGGGLFNKDDQTIVVATALPGYTFTNWTEGESIVSTNSTYSFTASANRTLVANFTINTYSLNVIAVNGNVVKNPNLANFNSGATVQLNATPNAGYTFTSWSGDATGSTNPLTVTMNSNKNITANFSLLPTNTYTINISAVNGSVVKNPDLANYSSGASVQLSATPDAGYSFTSWSGDATGSVNPMTVTMNSNKNITANFTLLATDTYTMDITAVNGIVVKDPDQSSYNFGTIVQLTAIPNDGYEFTGWGGQATSSINPLSITMIENKNIIANFTLITANTYTLDVISVNGDVLKNPLQVNYDNGDIVELTATPNSGYKFNFWSGDVTSSSNPISVLIDQDKTITANYTLTSSPGPDVVNLGSTNSFAILAGSGIANTGVTTTINGDVGSFPTATINGLLPGNVNGTLYMSADPIVGQAKSDLTAAYNDTQSRSLDAISLPGQIGGLTLAPGLYVNSTTSGISGTGPNGILTLDAGGNANAVWIFKMGSTFVTDAGTSIVLAGGAQADNIYWSVGTSATLGTNSIFYGNILADQAITLTTGATLYGRALTRIAAISLDSNTVTKP
ncbi:MAG: ice-binding family protein [Prolixibacteraceae bacterium]